MAPRNRALFALVGLFSAIAAGCSGGKSGGTPPTASPTNTPTAMSSATGVGPITEPSGIASLTAGATTTPFVLKTATPIPAASAPPTGAPNDVTSRPLANGDSFTYDGTTSQSFVFTGTSPNPSSTSVASVVQHVAVSTNKSFNGGTGLDEYATSETDTGNNATTTIVTDSYLGMTTGPSNAQTSAIPQTALTLYGSTSTDSSGESLTTMLTNPGYANDSGTVDLLPEDGSTLQWTNGIAETIDESESDGFTATRTYNADGSYGETATYPQTSAASPQPTPLTATITENSDGSGIYSLPLFSPPNITISFVKPTSAGLIVINFCCDSSGNTVATEQSSAWFPQPLSSSNPLYSEVDRNNGAVTIPSACNASTSYGTSANEVEQKYARVDTILGTLEYFDQLTYVADDGAAVCVRLNDTTYTFYDYTGQSNPDVGIAFSGGNSPLETQTVTTTLGLQSGAVANAGSRKNELAARVSASAVANARANFLHTVDHYRVQRERKMVAHLRTVLARFRR